MATEESKTIEATTSNGTDGPMTKRDMFERIASHLLKQNARSENGRTCMYFGAFDRKCAVGCLIKPEHYSSNMEHNSLMFGPLLLAVEKSVGKEIVDDELTMLRDLQKIHDYELVTSWEKELNELRNELFTEASA